ncbi:MAG: sulfurtransferase [Acidobacteria bacterium]|nr:sulfurtransferase [Acidobacteriota bacterium]
MDYEIGPAEVKKIGESGEDFILVDVREPWEFQTAHIAGAKLIPIDEIPARARKELNPDQHIVVYCHHGVRSLNATAWLRRQGFERAQSLSGGIDAWSRTIDPTVPQY